MLPQRVIPRKDFSLRGNASAFEMTENMALESQSSHPERERRISIIEGLVKSMHFEMDNFQTHQSAKSLKGGFMQIMHEQMSKFVRLSADKELDFEGMLEETKLEGHVKYVLQKPEDLSLRERLMIFIRSLNAKYKNIKLDINKQKKLLDAA